MTASQSTPKLEVLIKHKQSFIVHTREVIKLFKHTSHCSALCQTAGVSYLKNFQFFRHKTSKTMTVKIPWKSSWLDLQETACAKFLYSILKKLFHFHTFCWTWMVRKIPIITKHNGYKCYKRLTYTIRKGTFFTFRNCVCKKP